MCVVGGWGGGCIIHWWFKTTIIICSFYNLLFAIRIFCIMLASKYFHAFHHFQFQLPCFTFQGQEALLYHLVFPKLTPSLLSGTNRLLLRLHMRPATKLENRRTQADLARRSTDLELCRNWTWSRFSETAIQLGLGNSAEKDDGNIPWLHHWEQGKRATAAVTKLLQTRNMCMHIAM